MHAFVTLLVDLQHSHVADDWSPPVGILPSGKIMLVFLGSGEDLGGKAPFLPESFLEAPLKSSRKAACRKVAHTVVKVKCFE